MNRSDGGSTYTSVRGADIGTPRGFQHIETYLFPVSGLAPAAKANLSRRDEDGAVLVRITGGGEDGLTAEDAAIRMAEIAARNRIIFRDSRRPVPRVLYASEGRWREVTFESFRAAWRLGSQGRYRTLEVEADRALPAGEFLEIGAISGRCGTDPRKVYSSQDQQPLP